MAKVSMIQREVRREKLVDKYASKRASLKRSFLIPTLILMTSRRQCMRLTSCPESHHRFANATGAASPDGLGVFIARLALGATSCAMLQWVALFSVCSSPAGKERHL